MLPYYQGDIKINLFEISAYIWIWKASIGQSGHFIKLIYEFKLLLHYVMSDKQHWLLLLQNTLRHVPTFKPTFSNNNGLVFDFSDFEVNFSSEVN